MRTGRGATVGVVTKGVDVHATLGIGIVARDVPRDLGGSGLGLLLEDESSGDLESPRTTATADYLSANVSLKHQAIPSDGQLRAKAGGER